jgi:hypothetical protein
VVAAVSDRAAWGRILHVFHPDSVDFAAALTAAGAPVTQASCADFLAALRASAGNGTGNGTGRELAALAALLPAPGDHGEDGLRRELAALLTDNPSLYRRDECRRLEERWQLPAGNVPGAIAAYRAYLDETSRTAAAGAGRQEA